MVEDNQNSDTQDDTQDTAENSGMRAAEMNANPKLSLEEARNAAEGKGSNAAGGPASSTAEEHVPSSSEPEATDLPTAR